MGDKNKGVDARQMAAAPLKSSVAEQVGAEVAEQVAQQAAVAPAAEVVQRRANRFDGTTPGSSGSFVAITFKPADGTVYGNDGERKSKRIASVLVSQATGLILKGKVDAIQGKGSTKVVPEFRWIGTRQEGAVDADDPGAAADLKAWRDSVLMPAFMAWHTAAKSVPTEPATGYTLDITL